MKFLFSLLLFCFCIHLHAQIPSPPTIRVDKINIARDNYGVPHIFAPTDPEVAFGLAWAHAEDDLDRKSTRLNSSHT